MAYSGKTQPCPCGSGKVYEECCLFIDTILVAPEDTKRTIPDLVSILGGEGCSSFDQVKKEIEHMIEIGNAAALEDFCGLSSYQMSRFLYSPFESGDLITFNDNCDDIPDSPFLRLFRLIVDGLGKQGLKATATGNLPRNFCRQAAEAYYSEEEYKKRTKFGELKSEMDFEELNTVRLVADISGFIRKVKGKFMLTKKGLNIISNGIDGKSFKELFLAYAGKFNWGYRDRCPELHIVQMSSFFTLYILQKYGETFRDASFYEHLFIKAFPMALNEVRQPPIGTPEEEVGFCYKLRTLERFAEFFGFAELKNLTPDLFSRKYEVRKTPFLDRWIHFNV